MKLFTGNDLYTLPPDPIRIDHEGLDEMTLQVGLVGKNGIVIASDRQVTDQSLGGRSPTLSSKIQRYDGVVCCWSGGYPASRALECMREIKWDVIDKNSREEALRECGRRAWKNSPFGYHGEHRVLAAFPDGVLLELTVSDLPSTMQIGNQVVEGDRRSTARHLITTYMKERMDIRHLVILAAHAVLMAGQENPATVGGLEVAIAPLGGRAFCLSSAKEDELKVLSASIRARTSKELLRPFDYRPMALPISPEAPRVPRSPRRDR